MFRYIIIFTCWKIIAAIDVNESCVTPNGDVGICVPIQSCDVIAKGIQHLDITVILFAKESMCGDGEGVEAAVCCGKCGNKITPTTTTQHPIIENTTPFGPTNTGTTPTPPAPIQSDLLPDNSICGLQYKQDRIIGGMAAEIDEFPWLAALRYTSDKGEDGGYFCSGTLINRQYILTAAQCLGMEGYDLTEVRLGETRFSTDIDCSDIDEDYCAYPVVNLEIAEKIPHPLYSKRSGNNDIALLRLKKKINYSEFIRPICLPPSEYPLAPPGTTMEIAGWGVTENGSMSDRKLKVKVPMVDNSECVKVFPNFTFIKPNQACAGGEENRDACFRDSGGPLMRIYIFNEEAAEEQWFIEGIIYRGMECGRKGVPRLYTRVARYITWILNNLRH